MDVRRRADLALGAAWFVDRGLLDPANQNTAADVLGFLTGEDSFLYFMEESGWSHERYQTWPFHSINQLVLGGHRTRSN